jgi:hypothetical protein
MLISVVFRYAFVVFFRSASVRLSRHSLTKKILKSQCPNIFTIYEVTI